MPRSSASTITITPVREVVIVVRDLYLQPELARPEAVSAVLEFAPGTKAGSATASPGAAAPGIEQVARFGDEMRLSEGWRAWSARWLGLPQYADAAPASVAAVTLGDVPADRAVWLATPLHLIAGLTSLHFDRRSVLRVPGAELAQLAAGFRDTFRGSGFDLRPLGGGELLLTGPQTSPPAMTTEPARLLLTSVAESLPVGGALRRCGGSARKSKCGCTVTRSTMSARGAERRRLQRCGSGAVAHPLPCLRRPRRARSWLRRSPLTLMFAACGGSQEERPGRCR